MHLKRDEDIVYSPNKYRETEGIKSDRVKGIIAKPMPSNWYSVRDNLIKDNDDEETIIKKEFNMNIVASNKPYFMIYIYPSLKSKTKTYIKNNNNGASRRFFDKGIFSIEDLENFKNKTQDMDLYLKYYYKYLPVGINQCVVNRICKLFEDTFSGIISNQNKKFTFDYSILKSNVGYSKSDYKKIEEIYKNYLKRVDSFQQTIKHEKVDKDFCWIEYRRFASLFKSECERICSNQDELCDIVLDVCYQRESSKQFAWDICGDTMLENLLKQNNNTIHFPQQVKDDGDFTYCGREFKMFEKKLEANENDYS